MYKRILVTTDFSTHAQYALQRAVEFAASFQAELICVHVINQQWTDGMAVVEQEWVRKAEKAHAQVLQHLSCSYPMQFIVLDGRIPDQIIHFIREQAVDLVFMGAHGTYYLDDLILGTNSEAVVKQSPIPVQLIRKKPALGYERILVCTDFSKTSKRAIEVAYEAYSQAEFLVLHVADVWYGKNAKDDMHQALQNKLIKFLNTCNVDERRFAVKFIGGYPADDIAQYARTWGAQLVVLGTRGHSILHYILMGRVSNRLMRINATDMLFIPSI